MNLSTPLLDDILPRVERPARYLGTEYNSVHKDPAAVDLRIALAFPDLYDLGLGNLGLLVLYGILNELPWCWAERVYAPAPDMEAALRERGLPLFALESKDPLAAFDCVGFTLQSELTYTSVLNMLDLARLPVRAADRDEDAPLVMAGGPCAFNPEPMAPFVDFFVIGDGEACAVEVAETLRQTRCAAKTERLEALAAVGGVYVPTLTPVEDNGRGVLVPTRDVAPVRKRVVDDLDAAAFPTNYLVPFAKQVHDRVPLEVLRGCTHGCRFCHAGMTTRPVRERSVGTVDRLLRESLANTGYEEAALVSLSTCDHSHARRMLEHAAQTGAAAGASVSLPSLRLDTFSVELANLVTGVRRSGLTVAPEAASPRMRAVINKWVSDEDLFRMAEEAMRRGWRHLKLYFMLGLPTERDEDVEAIAGLATRALAACRGVSKGGKLNLGVSTFVPKAHTPFQWAAQIPPDEARRRQDLLGRALGRNSAIKFGRHNAATTFIEGLVSRGDRTAGDLIEAAWRHGARLDSSDEYLNTAAWDQAVGDTGYDVDAALGPREAGERLPWDHIDTLVAREFLEAEWQRALDLEHMPDCRQSVCHRCGVSGQGERYCEHVLEPKPREEPERDAPVPQEPTRETSPSPMQRVRFRIGRDGGARFLAHLEYATVWQRALRRAGFPVAYTQGFHAQPRVNFATAVPVGEESEADYMDVLLTNAVAPEVLRRTLAGVLPPGFHVYEAWDAPLGAPALMSTVRGFRYRVTTPTSAAEMAARVEALLASERLPVSRLAKQGGRKREKTVDVRPMIAGIRVEGEEGGRAVLRVETVLVDGRGVKPRELAGCLGLDPANVRFTKTATLFDAPYTPQTA